MGEYLPSKIIKMLHLDIKQPALIKAEKTGRVDAAIRRKRGKSEFRYFPSSAIPSIGKAFAKLPAPEDCVVTSVFVSKGGVGKTTTTYNYARFLALHGLRVLAIGTDFQRSLSRYFGLDINEKTYSLFELIGNTHGSPVTSIRQIIKATDLPNMFYVPESKELNFLDMFLYSKTNRERLLNDALEPIKSDFDAIVIDCPPWWSQLVSNALYASDCIIGPLTAEADSEYAFSGGLDAIQRFRQEIGKNWSMVKFFISAIDLRNKIEKEVQEDILSQYSNVFSPSYARRAVHVKEASALAQSVMEYDPASAVADDLYNVYYDLWSSSVLAKNASIVTNDSSSKVRAKRKRNQEAVR